MCVCVCVWCVCMISHRDFKYACLITSSFFTVAVSEMQIYKYGANVKLMDTCFDKLEFMLPGANKKLHKSSLLILQIYKT